MAQQNEEVRYHMLRPSQIVTRRKECPVAYIPVGTIEWHGQHNPVGADTLQADGLAIECARKGGGLVFPPLYYGESRAEGLMEANASDRNEIAKLMELPPDNFNDDQMHYTPAQQVENYQTILTHILWQVRSLGFSVGVLVAGHYPLIDHVRAAVLLFNQRQHRVKPQMLAWAFVDYLLVKDKWPNAGDHAGGWETSHVMHLHPETVDLDVLPQDKSEQLVGVGYSMPPQDSTAEFGKETMSAAADVAIKEVAHRLENPHSYFSHGNCLAEERWKT